MTEKTDEFLIRPCPFCAGKARLYRLGSGYFVRCNSAGCKAEQVPCRDKIEAVKRWNTRKLLVGG